MRRTGIILLFALFFWESISAAPHTTTNELVNTSSPATLFSTSQNFSKAEGVYPGASSSLPCSITASISMQTDVTCYGGNNGVLSTTQSDGKAPFSYHWSNGSSTTNSSSSTNSIGGLAAGTYSCTVTDADGCSASASGTISQPEEFSALITAQTNVLCSGENTGGLTVTQSHGIAPFTYQWSNGATISNTYSSTISLTALSAGTFHCTITDYNGCSASTTATITEPEALIVTLDVIDHVRCHGGFDGSLTATQVNGIANYRYEWSNGASTSNTSSSTNTISNLAAGKYSCTITDANNCSASASATVIEPTELWVSIDAQTNLSCNGSFEGEISLTPTGGFTPYAYSWSPSGGTSATASDLSAGTYTCTVTDRNGCTVIKSSTITSPAALVASIVSQKNVSCNGGSDGEILASASGGTSAYSFSWSPAGGSAAAATNLSAESYTCTVTDGNGCTATTSTTITEPSVMSALVSSQTNTSCNGCSDGAVTISALGGTLPYSYLWSPAGGTSATAADLTAGNYDCTVTDINGCTVTASATLLEPASFSASVSSQNNASCNGSADGTITVSALGGTAPYAYSWSPEGGTEATATGLSAGTYSCTVTDDNGYSEIVSATITEPAVVSALVEATTTISCNGNSNGEISVSASGGTAPYSYAWSALEETSATASGLAAGNYTCTVSDNNGCTATVSTTLTEPDLLSVILDSKTDISCNGGADGELALTVSGGTAPYSYSWSPEGGTSATATGLAAGSYTCSITDDSGCTTSITSVLSEPIMLSAAVSSKTDVSCSGNADGTISVLAEGGTAPYHYSWSPEGGTTATATGLSPTTYTCTITDDNGCSATSSAVISEPDMLAASISSQTNVSCSGKNDGAISVSVTGGNPAYTYSWSPEGGTAATANGLSAGTYVCTITDNEGCSTSVTATLTELSHFNAEISTQNNISCNGNADGALAITPSGGTAPYSYSWSPGGGTSGTATGLSAGTYTCTIADVNGCTITTSATLNEPTLLSASIISQTNVACNGLSDGVIVLAASGGTAPYAYLWSPQGGTSAAATGLSEGNYTCTITDDNGCSITTSATISEPALLSASISSQTNVSCYGFSDGEVSITGSGGTAPYSYSWLPEVSNSANAINLAKGTYSCTITDSKGCTAFTSATLTEPGAINSSVIVDQTQLSAELQTASAYQWIDCSDTSIIANATSAVFEPESDGDYAVIITVDSCTDTSACYTFTGIQTGLNHLNINQEILAYPNPADGSKVYFTGILQHVIVTTIRGEIIFTANEVNELDISDYKAGVYVIKSEKGNFMLMIK